MVRRNRDSFRNKQENQSLEIITTYQGVISKKF